MAASFSSNADNVPKAHNHTLDCPLSTARREVELHSQPTGKPVRKSSIPEYKNQVPTYALNLTAARYVCCNSGSHLRDMQVLM